MIIVTGGAGFIGANLVSKINQKGNSNIIIVDNIKKNKKNINNLKFKDYYDKNDFLLKINNKKFKSDINCIIHLGACSNTTETNWEYLKFNNILYTKKLYEFSKHKNCQFIYASSGSIYGNESGNSLKNNLKYKPLNLYGKSKLEVDKFFFQHSKKNVIGLRFFNVYGHLEKHKNNMCSPVTKFSNQLKENKHCNLFKFKPEDEPLRDFILVNDAVNILEFLKKKKQRGLYNIGTGKPETFVSIGKILIKNLGYGKINYIKFPAHLKKKYQFFTKANISNLKKLGFKKKVKGVESGIKYYLKFFKS